MNYITYYWLMMMLACTLEMAYSATFHWDIKNQRKLNHLMEDYGPILGKDIIICIIGIVILCIILIYPVLSPVALFCRIFNITPPWISNEGNEQ